MRQARKRWPYFLLFLFLTSSALVFLVYRRHRTPVAKDVSVPQSSLRTGAYFSEEDVVDGGTDADGIPPIQNPIFESVANADTYLRDDGMGIDVEMQGKHRFYPLQILVWHEVVNDTFQDTPLLITYSPLTGVGAVYDRRVEGNERTFRVSGKLWNNNSLLIDEQTTLWLQATGEAVAGSRTGTILTPVPSRIMRWSDWKYAEPAGQVLSRETGASRDYTENPYGNYEETPTIFFPLTHIDARLSTKELVYGVELHGVMKAYPAKLFERQTAVDDVINDTLLRVERDEISGAIQAFVRDQAGNEERLAVTQAYWFFWSLLYPSTDLYLP